MPNVDYLPTSDSHLLVWFNNFTSKFGTYAPALGFTAAEVTAVTDDYHMLTFVINGAEATRTASIMRTSYKNVLRDGPIGTVQPNPPTIPSVPVPATIVPPGILPRMRALVQRIKAQPAYTDTIGNDLGIVGTDSAVTRTKPGVDVTPEPGSVVRIDWIKAGYDGVLVESQRGDEVVWTSLGVDMQSPYTDSRNPLHPGAPEVRRYRLRYVQGDEPTGDYTDVVTVTTTP